MVTVRSPAARRPIAPSAELAAHRSGRGTRVVHVDVIVRRVGDDRRGDRVIVHADSGRAARASRPLHDQTGHVQVLGADVDVGSTSAPAAASDAVAASARTLRIPAPSVGTPATVAAPCTRPRRSARVVDHAPAPSAAAEPALSDAVSARYRARLSDTHPGRSALRTCRVKCCRPDDRVRNASWKARDPVDRSGTVVRPLRRSERRDPRSSWRIARRVQAHRGRSSSNRCG